MVFFSNHKPFHWWPNRFCDTEMALWVWELCHIFFVPTFTLVKGDRQRWYLHVKCCCSSITQTHVLFFLFHRVFLCNEYVVMDFYYGNVERSWIFPMSITERINCRGELSSDMFWPYLKLSVQLWSGDWLVRKGSPRRLEPSALHPFGRVVKPFSLF